ncbi:MAG TPA: DUF4249 family protein [Chitinophaga sp.]|uniref:DUF4249 family protein n=1 Tax=Chitinophaga sp. TaxID=1869181 RepID=UPI002C516163|nr:DUF4249 family protein [Chitinophaga sp.]HVI49559.1 DUF4249 family protein [Chitinophaga sp.]
MKYLLTIIPVICVVLLTGCEQELPVPPSNVKPRTVLYSELVADSVAEVRIGKSKPVGPGIDNKFEAVTNAEVQLTDKDGKVLETLTYVNDPNNNMSVYRGTRKLTALQNYRIQASTPELKEAVAGAWIPTDFKVTLIDTVRTNLNGRPVLRFQYNIQPQPGLRQYLVMEALKQDVRLDTFFHYQGTRYALKDNRDLYDQIKDNPGVTTGKDTTFLNSYYRIPCNTQDENADNNQIGGLNENYSSIFFAQTNKPITTNFYISANALTATIENGVPAGRVVVYVKSVSKDYYDFLLTYEKVKRNPGLNSLVQAIQLRNNVSGGLGIVGGCNQKVYNLYFDPL